MLSLRSPRPLAITVLFFSRIFVLDHFRVLALDEKVCSFLLVFSALGKQAVSIPVIANGDVYTRADMASIKALSGCRCSDRWFFSFAFCVASRRLLF